GDSPRASPARKSVKAARNAMPMAVDTGASEIGCHIDRASAPSAYAKSKFARNRCVPGLMAASTCAGSGISWRHAAANTGRIAKMATRVARSNRRDRYTTIPAAPIAAQAINSGANAQGYTAPKARAPQAMTATTAETINLVIGFAGPAFKAARGATLCPNG